MGKGARGAWEGGNQVLDENCCFSHLLAPVLGVVLKISMVLVFAS